MKKLTLLFLLVLLLPVNALSSCFEQFGTIVPAHGDNLRFTIGVDGMFYLAEPEPWYDAANSKHAPAMFYNSNGATWFRSIPPLSPINVFEALPDPANAGVLFVGGTNAYAFSTNGGQTWTKIGVPGTDYSGAAQWSSASGKLILVTAVGDVESGNIYNVSAPSFRPRLFVSTPFSHIANLSVSGNTAYLAQWVPAPASPSSGLITYDLNTKQGVGSAVNVIPLSAFLAGSDGFAYSGNTSGIVVKDKFATPEQTIAEMKAKILRLAEYKNKIFILANHSDPGKAFAYFDGTLHYISLNSTTLDADFLPVNARISPTDGKLYLLGKVGATWAVFKFVDSCITPPNSAPVVSISGPIGVSVNASAQLTASGSDVDGNTLVYNWTQLSGPVLNASAWNYSAGNSSISIFFVQNGTYIFNVNVTDNGVPNLTTSMNWSLVVNAIQVVQQPPVNSTSPVNNTISECIVSAECSANEQCTVGSCVLLRCSTGQLVEAHRCVEPTPTTLCGGVQRTGEGTCCSGQWLPGQTTCPAPQNSSSTNHTVPVNGGVNASQSPLAFLDKLTNNNSTANYAIIVVVVLVLLGLVYFLFLKKKPPKQELQDELDQPLATDAGSSEPTVDETPAP